MDKQGRLTKWEELEKGAIYEWRKGRTTYGRFIIEEINRSEGWIGVRNVDGVVIVKNFNWQRRYRKLGCSICGATFKAAVDACYDAACTMK